MNKIKGALKSKTIRYAFCVLIFGMLEVLQNNIAFLAKHMSVEMAGWFTIAIGFGVVFFRWITTEALEDK